MRFWIILLTFFLSFVFWESSFLFPFKMLAVLIHELWHSLMAMFFNVDWIQFHIFEDESAKTMIKGDLPFFGFILTASSGYIGTVLTASLFLRNFLKQELEDLYYFIFCLLLLIISFVFIPFGTLAFQISFLWSIGLFILYFINKNIAFLCFTSIQSFILFYSFYDLLDFSKNPFQSDIGILYYFFKSKNINLGESVDFIYFISFIWISIILYIFYKFILSLLLEEESTEFSHSDTEKLHNLETQNTNGIPTENTNIEEQKIITHSTIENQIPTDEKIEKLLKNE
ncbi:MAG: hypothetical protein KatS3mg129_2471 [Leptospiraceae bacterium]|nr:MAG: hypothetical protein KatS3mg129_2471 [Leptospiraceae bacterium]